MTTKPLEYWAREKNVPHHAIAGAKIFNRWGQGHQLTEDDFDKGMHAYENIPMGGEPPPAAPTAPGETPKAPAAPESDEAPDPTPGANHAPTPAINPPPPEAQPPDAGELPAVLESKES